MKKLVQINVVSTGSTGKIMTDIALLAQANNYETYCFFGRGKKTLKNQIKINSKLAIYFHILLARFGFNGRGSYFETKRLVKKLEKINPDIIHLHNIHGYYLNLKVFFNYLQKYQGKIIWTLHDCWTFTGHCAYFTISGCKKWQKGCFNCPNLKSYPKVLFDTTKKEYNLKKELFLKLNNLTLVTPSEWLKKLVKKSFLKDYFLKVINNGIDLTIFKPTYDETIYKKYNISKDKKIILGVANIWEERKGLNDFIELAKILPNSYQIVLVGISSKLKNKLPSQIIAIQRTENQEELAKLYTIATIFFNPTYEDNYPTTNLESLACKTPVITYDTGGSKEIIKDYGYIIKPKEFSEILKILKDLPDLKLTDKLLSSINKENKYLEYLNLYK